MKNICSNTPLDRCSHTYGKAFRDIVRGLRRDFQNAPDGVAYPRSESDLRALLDWCGSTRVAAIPYGGGSSVVGGTEARMNSDYDASLCIDLANFNRVLEIDHSSRAARFEAGIFGPDLENALRPHGLTLRHFPQSFEFSTLGGWIATRSGGHYATHFTHIDEFVEALRVITPKGVMESRRLPGSGAGPSPDRLWIGSEGTLGIITEAWMRLQERPRFRVSTSVLFPGEDGFLRGAEAVRILAQSGLEPSNCRLLDPTEAQTAHAGDGSAAVLVLGFESADHPLDPWMKRALEICSDVGGQVSSEAATTRDDREVTRQGAAGAWRKAFLEAPYLRDVLTRAGVITETFETAITWNRFAEFHRGVRESVENALQRICGGGLLACRFTHAYPDGAAPYYSVIAPGKRNALLEQWDEIKSAAMDAVVRHGGTITHHHAVGRDHRPGYDAQRPELFARALRSIKADLDPSDILNPGVLIDCN